ncbi:hypothetical protein DFP96_10287 [Listeria rocourtiae]|uniref:Uncharacterized protein n=1 Tax=Listeria rocourtiae TaxID=647910 RepID=A0A4R6ZPK9_9LIST|nr:hypothetical protein DFP96_10287 [Listeria rocourtiae]
MNEIYCSAEYAVTGATKAEIMQKGLHWFVISLLRAFAIATVRFHSPGVCWSKNEN